MCEELKTDAIEYCIKEVDDEYNGGVQRCEIASKQLSEILNLIVLLQKENEKLRVEIIATEEKWFNIGYYADDMQTYSEAKAAQEKTK